jgi:hypothetical protein
MTADRSTALLWYCSWTVFLLTPLLLIVGLALYTLPDLTPVGVVIGASLSVAVLSYPVLTATLAYALRLDSPAAPSTGTRSLSLWALCSLTLLLIGLVSVLVAGDALRVIGDLLYLGGIVTSYLLSGTILYRW